MTVSRPGSVRLSARVTGSIRSGRVVEVLAELVRAHGDPRYLRSDNGPEFVATAGLTSPSFFGPGVTGEWLATEHRHLEWVDLRVGAASEDEGARKSRLLRVCLDEVRRAGPFVIALGDRYDWVPAATDAAAAAAEIGFASAVAGRSVTYRTLVRSLGPCHEELNLDPTATRIASGSNSRLGCDFSPCEINDFELVDLTGIVPGGCTPACRRVPEPGQGLRRPNECEGVHGPAGSCPLVARTSVPPRA